jgi:hypothetical protein
MTPDCRAGARTLGPAAYRQGADGGRKQRFHLTAPSQMQDACCPIALGVQTRALRDVVHPVADGSCAVASQRPHSYEQLSDVSKAHRTARADAGSPARCHAALRPRDAVSRGLRRGRRFAREPVFAHRAASVRRGFSPRRFERAPARQGSVSRKGKLLRRETHGDRRKTTRRATSANAVTSAAACRRGFTR